MDSPTGYLRVAPEYVDKVRFDPIRPAGFRILAALDRTAAALGVVLEITCGSNGHPPGDPHTDGCAYDVRTHKFDDETKERVLTRLLQHLSAGGLDTILEISNGLATAQFYGFIEARGTPNEHLHIQRRRGVEFPSTLFQGEHVNA